MKPEFRILSTTAILGYGFPEASFKRGLKRKPHLIAADAGSTDPGPYYLGAGVSFTDRAAVKRDLRLMITEGVKRGIPVIIGSAGGCGAKVHVDWCESIIQEIAKEEKLRFTLGIAYADIPKQEVQRALQKKQIVPLPCVPALTKEALHDTTHVVAQMGMEPIIDLLQKKCQVIMAGRTYDPAVFAALPVMLGYDKRLALHLGKILECAAIAATPGSGSDCALGILKENSFILESLNPKRSFTRLSAAAHTLYEKSDPTHLPGPGGVINLEKTSFTELPKGRVEVRGSRFEPTPQYFVKLEGAKRMGYRTIAIAGVRDPIMIRGIEPILQEVRKQVENILKRERIHGTLHFHVYGKDGVMGSREPVKTVTSHELCIVIEALCPTQNEADSLCGVARSSLLHFGYPGRMATAGNLAFPFSPSDAHLGAVYTFTLYHLMPLKNPNGFKKVVKQLGKSKGGQA